MWLIASFIYCRCCCAMELRSNKKSGLFLYLRERFGLDLQWQNHKLRHQMPPILNVQLQGRFVQQVHAPLVTIPLPLGSCSVKHGLHVLGDACAHPSELKHKWRLSVQLTWCGNNVFYCCFTFFFVIEAISFFMYLKCLVFTHNIFFFLFFFSFE